MEVLRLVAEGLSTQEIAGKLIVSVNTVRTHIQHILEKLNARDRLHAITRAKELN